VRQVESLATVSVRPVMLTIDGTLGSYFRAALRVFSLNFQPHRYDLIHAHTGHSGVLACLQVRYPAVFTYYGYDLDVPAEDREGPRTKLERLVFRQLSRFVAGTIAQSERGRSHLPRAGLARNAVIPNGIDRELFAPMPRDQARRALGWEPEPPVVLFAADPTRFTKRFELARLAVAEAQRHRPDLKLEICGSVSPTDVPLWMNAADVLLLTSVGEGSPNVVKEAMACNLPVVSVDVGDVREVIEGTRQCHIRASDPGALAGALLEVLSALPERSDGREKSSDLDERTIALRLRDVYEQACLRGPGLFGFLPARLHVRSPSRASDVRST